MGFAGSKCPKINNGCSMWLSYNASNPRARYRGKTPGKKTGKEKIR